MDKGKAFGDKTGSPNVLMIYETERAEQYRGVPYLAPVIEALKQLTRYSEAEMMAAVINGFLPSSLRQRTERQTSGSAALWMTKTVFPVIRQAMN